MAEQTVQTIETTATPTTVFEVATDVERYPEWASAVKEVEVLERDDDGYPVRVRFTTDIMIKEITYVLEYTWDGAPGEMRWTAEPTDDIKSMVGRYEFRSLDDGTTEVLYALGVELGFKVPGFLRRQAERQLVGTALRGLKKRAEAVTAD